MASNLHKSLTSVRIRLIVGLTAILLVVLGIAINGFWAFAAMRSSAYNATSVGGSLNSIGLEIQVHNLETYRLIELARGQNQEKALPRLEEAALEIEDEYSRMGAELAIAQRLQRMILPGVEEIRAVPGMDIAAFDVIVGAPGVTCSIGDVTAPGGPYWPKAAATRKAASDAASGDTLSSSR
jgi:hypothetical protein